MGKGEWARGGCGWLNKDGEAGRGRPGQFAARSKCSVRSALKPFLAIMYLK